MNRLIITVLLAVILSVFCGGARAQGTLTLGPVAKAPVSGRCVYVDQADGAKGLAGAALAQWLSKATGQAIVVSGRPADASAAGFYVGFGTPLPGGAAYSIDIQSGDRVVIDGRDAASLRMAVYDFLETDLGFKFWSFDEADLPEGGARVLKVGKREVKPGFEQLFLWNREADNMAGDFRYATRSMAGPKLTGTHNLYALIADYAQTHPNVYPMDKRGERGPNDQHLCYSAAGLPEAMADALGEAVKRRRGNVKDWVYFVGPGNLAGTEGGVCECSQCQRVYREEMWTDVDGRKYPGHSATLLRMMNQTAQILAKRYPGIKVGVLMEQSQDAPPGETKPADNLIVQVRRVNTDAVHGVDQSLRNQAFMRKIQRWSEIAPGRTYVWESGANFDNMLVPFPNLKALCESIGFYKTLGVAGVTVEGSHGSPGSDAVVMKNWVLSRKLWDPGLTTAGLMDAFCKGYYGPAGEKVRQYLEELDATVNAGAGVAVSEQENPMRGYLTKESLVRLDGILEAAAKATAGAPEAYGRRVAQLRAGVQAARFWEPGPMEEHEGNLVRTDFDFDIRGQVEAMVKNLRGGSARDGVAPRWFYQALLRQSGGPVVTLTSDTIQAEVAPVQGAIWKVYYADLPIMEDVKVQPWGVGALTGTTADGATFSGAVGITEKNNVPQWMQTTRLLFKNGVLELTTDLRQSGQESLPQVLTQTRYPAPPGDRVMVEVLDQGQYVPVAFKAGERGVSLGKFEAIRVRYYKASRTITDKYLDVARGLTGELSHDIATGAVTVEVKLPDVVTQADKDVTVCRREVTFGMAPR